MNTIYPKKFLAVLSIGWTLLLYLLVFLTGCAPFLQTTKNDADVQSSSEQDSALSALKSLFWQAYNARENPDSLRRSAGYLTEILEKTGQNSIEQAALQRKSAELNYLCATYAPLSEDSSHTLYAQGSEVAASLLESYPDLYHFIFNGTVPENPDALKRLPEAVLDGVYWWSLNYLFWLREESSLARLLARATVERAIRVLRVADPAYRWGATSRLTGLMLLISPDGDLNRAREAFRQAIASEKDYLENRYLYGRYYGVLLQNKQIFHTQLDSILKANPAADRPYHELNTLVKSRTTGVLKQEGSYFFSITHSDILKGTEIPTD